MTKIPVKGGVITIGSGLVFLINLILFLVLVGLARLAWRFAW